MKKYRKKIVIVQRVFTKYRKPFIQSLKDELNKANIDIVFIYGQYTKEEEKKADNTDLVWGCKIKNRYLPFGLVWQPAIRAVLRSDLVIVEQANKLLLNYLLLLLRPFYKFKIAFWGHGLCHQQSAQSLSNKFKLKLLKQPDWWFAYTFSVTKFLAKHGIDNEKITTVQNSIDTGEVKKYRAKITETDLTALKEELGIEKKAPVGAFCGGMYKEKELQFLIEAVKKVFDTIPDFKLIMIGGGPDSELVKTAAANEKRIIYVGPRFGEDKVKFLALANLFLMPGLVGLAVLDCFALGLPIITTDYPFHSPEITYINNGCNGIITKFDKTAYADAVISLLSDSRELKRISANALASSNEYTIERMAENFAQGIFTALVSE